MENTQFFLDQNFPQEPQQWNVLASRVLVYCASITSLYDVIFELPREVINFSVADWLDRLRKRDLMLKTHLTEQF